MLLGSRIENLLHSVSLLTAVTSSIFLQINNACIFHQCQICYITLVSSCFNLAEAKADYYIIAGVVYQAPDLGSVFNSRMVNITTSYGVYMYVLSVSNA